MDKYTFWALSTSLESYSETEIISDPQNDRDGQSNNISSSVTSIYHTRTIIAGFESLVEFTSDDLIEISKYSKK